MKKFFRLYEECFLIQNKNKSSAIYNVLDGNVYEIDAENTQILSLCENNIEISEIAKILNLEFDSIFKILKDFSKNNIGTFFERPVYVEKMIIDKTWQNNSFLKVAPTYRMAYIILENECNKECKGCNIDYIRKFPCMGCFKSNNQQQRAEINKYLKFIDYLKEVGVNEIYFSGGDITNHFEENLKIIKYASMLGINKLFIFLGNYTTISLEQVEQLRKLNINLFFNFYLNENNCLQEKEKLEMLFKKEKDSALIMFPDNITIQTYNKVINKIKVEYNPFQIFTDIYIYKKDLYKNRKKLHDFRRTSIYDFSLVRANNKCMNGMITFFTNGNIGVCPRLSELTLGNSDYIVECTKNEKLDKYWKLTKDNIDKCGECHLRYICSDCRFTEFQFDHNLLAMNTCPLEE